MKSKKLSENILSSNFEGLSGKIIFKNGKLLQSPLLRIINVIGKSYREIAFWSPKLGFSESFSNHDSTNVRISNGSSVDHLGQIFWPGGLKTVPKGYSTCSDEKKSLRIGVPATGAFSQFVSISHDHDKNKTCFSGFSIELFEEARKQLHYELHHVFVPFTGLYDDMVEQVYKKVLYLFPTSWLIT